MRKEGVRYRLLTGALVVSSVCLVYFIYRTSTGNTGENQKELVFQIARDGKDNSADVKIARWRIYIPKNFVWLETGSNDAVSTTRDPKLRSVSLYALPNKDNTSFVPGTTDLSDNESIFFIHLRNRTAPSRLKGNACIREPELYETTGGHCRPDKYVVRCNVYMEFEGWLVKIGVPKQFYEKEYIRCCSMVRDFLSENTTAIDNISDMSR